MIWSPVFRIIMMLWFTTCLWTVTYFNGEVLKGFEEENLGLENPKVKGKGNNLRMLVGLETRYPTQVSRDDYGLALQATIKAAILIIFPTLTFIWLQKNFDHLDLNSVTTKFGTLYTDMKTSKITATQSIVLLCLRRFIIALTTVFLNKYIIVSFFIYSYGSTWFLGYYISRKPFNWRWAYALELMNESFLIVGTYFMSCFSEYILDIQTRYQVGNFFIDMIVVVIILNQIGIWMEVANAVIKMRRK